MAGTAHNPLTKAEIARIAKMHADGKTRNDIAKALGRSGSTISAYCKRTGLTFDRATTAAATAAKKADAAALRAQLELDYLDDAQHLRRRIRATFLVFEWGGKDHMYAEKEISEPPPADQLKLMQASVAASNASLRIEQARSDGGVLAAKSLVTDLAAHFGLAPADA